LTNRFVTEAPHKIKVTICHTAGIYGEENDDWNSAVFRSRRNRSSDGAERTDGGRASPSVVRRVDGMTSVDVEALRRRRRDPTSAVKWRVSARYDGAVPLRQRYTRTQLEMLEGRADGRRQVAQLSQRNRAAAWVSFGWP